MKLAHKQQFTFTVAATVFMNAVLGGAIVYFFLGNIEESSRSYETSQEELHLIVLERIQINEREKRFDFFEEKRKDKKLIEFRKFRESTVL